MAMLDGIRIIDMTSVIFGPYATQMLADMGAEVIKVEAPGGDVVRLLGHALTTPDMGSIHMTVNRGKKSIVLDLKQEADAEILRALIKTADVFIHNVRAQAIDKLGFGYDAAILLNPTLIYAHCTGFGAGGPYEDLQAYDDIIQAATGTTTLLSRVDGDPRPRYLPSLIADKVAGLYGAQAVLAALVHKLRTGEGQHVEVPMLETFTSFMLTEHLRDGVFEPPIGPLGYPRQLDPNRQPFPTADGHIAIVPYTDAKIVQLFDLMGAPEVLHQEGLTTTVERMQNFSRIYMEIALLTPARTTAVWLSIFAANDMPAFPIRDLSDVCADPHLLQSGFFRLREHPDCGRFREMAPPIRFSADDGRTLGFAPKLDEHGPSIRANISQK